MCNIDQQNCYKTHIENLVIMWSHLKCSYVPSLVFIFKSNQNNNPHMNLEEKARLPIKIFTAAVFR